MARVPIFEGGQRRAPLHQSNFTVRARPEAFGAAAGRGLVALGQGVGDVGEAITTVADLRAQNALKNAQADYMEGARALASDPDTGFLSRTGSAALGGRAGVEQLLNELGQRTAETLPRGVHAQFRDFRTRHDTSILGEYLKHEAQQTKVQTQAASQRRVSTLRQEAVRNHTDPVAHLNSLQEAETEFRTMAGWNGLSGEATEQMLAQHRENVQSDIILQKAEADPLAAEVYYDTIKDSLQDETRQQIDKILNPTLTIARAEAKADEITVGLSATGSGNIVQDAADLLVDSVDKNASVLTGTANSATLTGSAGNDNLTAPDDAAVAPDPERAQRVEQVRRNVRQRSDLNALRLARAGVMLSPGNLLLSTILGAPLAIAVHRADPASPVSSLLADTLGLASDAPVRAELDSELGEATAGDLSAEFSKGAAIHVGGVDVEASLNGVADLEERSLVRNQITATLTTQDRQRREAATARVQGAFAAIKEGGSLSGLSLEDRAELDGELRQAALEYQQALAAGGDPKTDFSLAHTLARLFAQDPDYFAGVNIFKHRARFSKAAFGVLESWHELARNGSDEADERAAEIFALYEQGVRQVTDAGLDPNSRNKDDQQKISRFLFRFLAETNSFKNTNGTLPKAEDLEEIARQLRPLLLEAPEPPIPVPADNPSRPDFRHWVPWKLRYEQYLGENGDNHADAVTRADQDVEEAIAFNKANAGIPLGDMSPVERAFVDQVRFQMFSGPEGIPGSFGRFMADVIDFALDLTPGVGDFKAFYEAEDATDTALAVAGLLPYLGDIGAKLLKRLIKVGKKDLNPPPDKNPLDASPDGSNPPKTDTKNSDPSSPEPEPDSRNKDGDNGNQVDEFDINAIDYEHLAASDKNLDPADKQGKLTYAGRALDKHGSNQGKRADSDAFPKPSGNQAAKNAQGQMELEGILGSSDKVVISNKRGGIDVFESPNGRGVRFNENDQLTGFLEPRTGWKK